jgi:multiple sugar transport system substrate-binding protein
VQYAAGSVRNVCSAEEGIPTLIAEGERRLSEPLADHGRALAVPGATAGATTKRDEVTMDQATGPSTGLGTGTGMTRRRLGVAAALAAGGVAAACVPGGSGGGTEGGQAGSRAKDTGPIVVYQWDAPGSPFGDWLKSYFEAFPQKTGIQLSIYESTSTAPLQAQQSAWLASGDAPDVFPRTGRGALGFAAFASKNAIRPLSDFIKRDKFDLSDFWPAVIKLLSARDKQWVMPQDFNQTILAYDAMAFQQAGAAPPPGDWKDASWNWNELLKRLQQVQTRLGSSGSERWALSHAGGHWNFYLWGNGGDYLSEDGTRVTLAEPPAVEALDFAARLVYGHRVSPPPGVTFPPGHVLATQSVAATTLPAAQMNIVRGQNRELQFDVAPFPKGTVARGRHVAGGGGGGYTMFGQTKHPDAAWELLTYIGAREYAVEKVRNGALGPRISVAKEHFVQKGLPPKNAAVYLDAPEHARWEPNLTNWDELLREVNAALQPLWRGEKAAREVAADAKRAAENVLAQGEFFR